MLRILLKAAPSHSIRLLLHLLAPCQIRLASYLLVLINIWICLRHGLLGLLRHYLILLNRSILLGLLLLLLLRQLLLLLKVMSLIRHQVLLHWLLLLLSTLILVKACHRGCLAKCCFLVHVLLFLSLSSRSICLLSFFLFLI